MALLSLTFPPGTLATVVKSGGSTWTVTSVNTTTVTVTVDDINDNGTISNAEWDAAIGGGGNDTGSINYLFEGTGSSGQLYALNGTTFTVGQNVTAIKSTLSNSFEANVSSVICLTKGTDVLTSTGWRAIEAISVGDAVVTANDNSEVVRWIGQRRLDRTDLENNPKLYPVRISKGTLGNGLPLRDLLVSRQHRVLVQSNIATRMFGESEVLVSAIKLTKVPGIFVDETVEHVEYFHLLFDKHEIIFAEGASTESLFTGPEALKAVNVDAREEIIGLFPELTKLSYAPDPARHIPTGKQQKRLVARHIKKMTPFLR